ncbi:SycD/LcrH family type III secretion system chaperone [Pseudomonas rubra]|uniref:SycD/LcrH family type III secretion system chaperone n=1 Tax=Pseudomonas rubra TaxID=2942627 RepID=A0ABT5PCH3_9PSED|nr:SycD/LcrH family type III secretion system chaperone [Pseudomonas rubra]MDD1016006.1 SycD/LcrH family type III secretion system chaperone [Pseudomonas rubra]MDD1039223.1 SycD/LcrH family type III secretion system chaperone [Pseudomonas rubra]MDD1155193.1 SycD/LcrH family type III secretion system chaperone [Pseudomonas rubra]
MNDGETLDEDVALGIADAVMAGATLRDIHGLSDEHMDNLYAFAYRFYEQGRLDDAGKVFHFLCIYDFHNSQYWTGLAAVHQLKKDYAKAIDLYSVALLQDDKDCRPMFFAGQCQLAMGKPGKARRCFNYVLRYSSDRPLQAQAQSCLQALDQLRDNDKE